MTITEKNLVQKSLKSPLTVVLLALIVTESFPQKAVYFVDAKGSGDFAGNRVLSVTEQFEQMKETMAKKWGYGRYLIYFQAFTNTYGSIDKLRQLYFEAANLPNVVGISIATRPDCLDSEVLSLLNELQK